MNPKKQKVFKKSQHNASDMRQQETLVFIWIQLKIVHEF